MAVEDVTYNINSGEVVSFLRLNGTDKTTTLKMITGLRIPDAGPTLIASLDINI